jgi:hypothetical protein
MASEDPKMSNKVLLAKGNKIHEEILTNLKYVQGLRDAKAKVWLHVHTTLDFGHYLQYGEIKVPVTVVTVSSEMCRTFASKTGRA